MSRFISLCGALLIATAFVAPVSAHTTLRSSDPANGSRIQSWPGAVTLTFEEPLATIKGAKVNQVEITNAKAQSVGGALTVNGSAISVATLPNSAAGPVLVNYRVAAADGHVVEGEFTFDYEPADASSTPEPTSPTESHSQSSSSDAIVKASTGLVVLALIVGIFVYRRKL